MPFQDILNPQVQPQAQSQGGDFLSSIQNDPAMKQALMMAAGTLFQGPGTGETMGSVLGRALQAGTLAHGFARANQQRNALAAQEMERQKLKDESDMAQAAANIEASKSLTRQRDSATTRDEEMHPLELNSKRSLIDKNNTLTDLQAKNLVLQQDVLRSSTEKNRAQAEKARRPNDPKGDGKPTREQFTLAQLRVANPDATDQEISQMFLDQSKKVTKPASSNEPKLSDLSNLLMTLPEGTPEHEAVKQKINAALGVQAKPEFFPQEIAAWNKAMMSVPPGHTFRGPDGQEYTRPLK